MTLPATFWSKTARSDCIVWVGAVNNKGYACFAIDGKSRLAHRVAWEDVNGPIPEGMTVDHLCRVRNCVNVDHLELVTPGDNTRRMHASQGFGLGGACVNGHDLTAANISLNKRGRTVCLPCQRDHRRDLDIRTALADGQIPARWVRDWALENGIPVKQRGKLSPDVWAAYLDAHREAAS